MNFWILCGCTTCSLWRTQSLSNWSLSTRRSRKINKPNTNINTQHQMVLIFMSPNETLVWNFWTIYYTMQFTASVTVQNYKTVKVTPIVKTAPETIRKDRQVFTAERHHQWSPRGSGTWVFKIWSCYLEEKVKKEVINFADDTKLLSIVGINMKLWTEEKNVNFTYKCWTVK